MIPTDTRTLPPPPSIFAVAFSSETAVTMMSPETSTTRDSSTGNVAAPFAPMKARVSARMVAVLVALLPTPTRPIPM